MNYYDALLGRLGITSYTIYGEEYLCNCIFCGDVKNNLQINFIKGLFHCWSCDQGGSLFYLIYKITGLNRNDANKLFHLDEPNIERNIQLTLDIMLGNSKKYNYKKFLVKERFDKWKKSRKIFRKLVSELNLGYDSLTQRLVIPLTHDKKCVGFCRRALLSYQKPKYLNTKNFSKNKFIFGYDSIQIQKEYILITEGPLDAINMRQLDFNSIALMGSTISDYNLNRIVSDFDKVCLMLDNDKAGKEAQRGIANRFLRTGVNVFNIEYDAEDPGDVTSLDQLINYKKYSLI